MKYILIGTMLFILIIMYYSVKNYGQLEDDAKHKNKTIFLVTIPTIYKDAEEIKSLQQDYKRILKQSFLALIILVFPIFFMNSIWSFFYFMLWLCLAMILPYQPLRICHQKLKQIKAKRKWCVLNENVIHIDLSLSSYMERMTMPYSRFTIPIGLLLLGMIITLKYHEYSLFLILLIEIVIAFIGMYFISHISNITYCTDTSVNIKLNEMRKKMLFKFIWYLCMSDACLELMIIFLLVIQDYYTPVLIFLAGAIIFMVMGISLLIQYSQKKKEILQIVEENLNQMNYDQHWRIGLLGPVYDNPNDSRTLIPSPNGMQMMFNVAKPIYRYFIAGIVVFIILLLGYLFGYPYYLDMHHELAELSYEQEILKVDGPFYHEQWHIDEINKVELTEKLGKGIRNFGTSAIVYDKGNYTFDNYGKCEVYLASLHAVYIVLYTNDNIYIINDDEEEKTKAIYQLLDKEVNNNDTAY